MGRTRHTCNNCAIEPCAIRNALRTEPFGDIIGTHGVVCKFHVYKPKVEAEPAESVDAGAQEQVVENATQPTEGANKDG